MGGHRVAEFLDDGQVGYLLHREELLPDFDETLDFLQARGRHIATLSERRMTTTLAEGSAMRVLDEVTRRARGGDNLFGVKTAIDDPRQFFGRNESLARVGSMLARGEHVLLLGTRKSGKTSFLNILRQQLVSDHPVAWVDLQQFDPDSHAWPVKLFMSILASFDGWGRAHFDKRWPFGGDSVVDGSTFTEQVHRRRAFLVSEVELERVREDVRAGESVVVIGGRRAGKTRLIEELGDVGRPLYRSSADGWRLSSERDAIAELGRALGVRCTEREELEAALHERAPLALVIDEADRLLSERWAHGFYAWLRYLSPHLWKLSTRVRGLASPAGPTRARLPREPRIRRHRVDRLRRRSPMETSDRRADSEPAPVFGRRRIGSDSAGPALVLGLARRPRGARAYL